METMRATTIGEEKSGLALVAPATPVRLRPFVSASKAEPAGSPPPTWRLLSGCIVASAYVCTTSGGNTTSNRLRVPHEKPVFNRAAFWKAILYARYVSKKNERLAITPCFLLAIFDEITRGGFRSDETGRIFFLGSIKRILAR